MKTIHTYLKSKVKGLAPILSLLMIVIASNVSGQNLTCSGVVTDELNEEAVSGAEVNIFVTEEFGQVALDTIVVTNTDGAYFLETYLSTPTEFYSVEISVVNFYSSDFCDEIIQQLPAEVQCDLMILYQPPVDCEAMFNYHPTGDPFSFQFTDLSYGDVVSWSWDFGDGNESILQHPIHTFEESGSYEVVLEIETANGSCMDIFTEYVNVFTEACENDFESEQTSGTTFEFVGFAFPDDVETEFYWTIEGETETFSGQMISYEFELDDPSIPQVFQVQLFTLSILTPTDSCEAISTKTVLVMPIQEMCSVDFNIDTLDAYRYRFTAIPVGELIDFQWDFGDGNIDEGIIVEHTFEEAGDYDVTLTAICVENQQEVEQIKELVIYDTNECNVYFTVDTIDLYTYKFINLSSGTLQDYEWDFGGMISNDESPEHVFPSVGEYTVCLTATCAETGEEDEYCFDLEIIDECKADFQFLVDTTNLLGGVFKFENLSSANNITNVSWDFGDGTESDLLNPVHEFFYSGSYEVCLSIETEDGCDDEVCKTVTVDPVFNLGGHLVPGDNFVNNPLNDKDSIFVSLYRFSNDDHLYLVGSKLIFGDNWYYSFPKLHAAKYIVRAELTKGSEHAEDYSFAYHYQNIMWNEAQEIELTTNAFDKEIHLIEMISYDKGSSQIAGMVDLVDPNIAIKENDVVSIALLNSSDRVIEVEKTTGDLAFSFGDLPAGKYKLYADIPGYYSEFVSIVIPNDGDFISDVSIHVYENDINRRNEFEQHFDVDVFPNPTQNMLTISFDEGQKSEYEVIIYNTLSVAKYKEIIDTSSQNKFKVDLSTYANGLYVICFKDLASGKVFSKKIIKN